MITEIQALTFKYNYNYYSVIVNVYVFIRYLYNMYDIFVSFLIHS